MAKLLLDHNSLPANMYNLQYWEKEKKLKAKLINKNGRKHAGVTKKNREFCKQTKLQNSKNENRQVSVNVRRHWYGKHHFGPDLGLLGPNFCHKILFGGFSSTRC